MYINLKAPPHKATVRTHLFRSHQLINPFAISNESEVDLSGGVRRNLKRPAIR